MGRHNAGTAIVPTYGMPGGPDGIFGALYSDCLFKRGTPVRAETGRAIRRNKRGNHGIHPERFPDRRSGRPCAGRCDRYHSRRLPQVHREALNDRRACRILCARLCLGVSADCATDARAGDGKLGVEAEGGRSWALGFMRIRVKGVRWIL